MTEGERETEKEKSKRLCIMDNTTVLVAVVFSLKRRRRAVAKDGYMHFIFEHPVRYIGHVKAKRNSSNHKSKTSFTLETISELSAA